VNVCAAGSWIFHSVFERKSFGFAVCGSWVQRECKLDNPTWELDLMIYGDGGSPPRHPEVSGFPERTHDCEGVGGGGGKKDLALTSHIIGFPVWCGRNLLVSTELWPQPHLTPSGWTGLSSGSEDQHHDALVCEWAWVEAVRAGDYSFGNESLTITCSGAFIFMAMNSNDIQKKKGKPLVHY